jgi:hypothetical protein
MKPEDIVLRNTSQEFQYEKMSREIDECEDVDQLQQMCKFLIKMEMKTRENYSVMIQDIMSAIPDAESNTESGSPH